ASAHDAGRTADVRGAVVLAAKLRRGLVDRRDWLRARRWPDELGYRPRTPSTAPIVPTEEAAPPTTLARTESDVVGVVTGGSQADPVVAAAELLGLTVQARGAGEVTRLADQAL